MRLYRHSVIALVWAFGSAGTVSICHAEPYPKHHPVPGGIAVIGLNIDSKNEVTARFGRTPILTIEDKGSWYGVVGIDLDTAQGNYLITVNTSSADPITKEFSVSPHGYLLKTKRDHTETPQPLNSPDVWRPELDASFPLLPPVATAKTVPFGTRYAEEKNMGPELWAVFHLMSGQEVVAPGQGVVADIFKAEEEETFYVTIDHGMGLYSSVGPLKRLRTENGQQVDKGEVVGEFEYDKTVSRSVYWKTALNGVAVNPMLFTDQTKE